MPFIVMEYVVYHQTELCDQQQNLHVTHETQIHLFITKRVSMIYNGVCV